MADKTSGQGGAVGGGKAGDAVLAELFKRRQEQLAKLKKHDQKIRERQRALSQQERKERNRLLMLWGIAHYADVEMHPERRAEAMATLNRGITGEKDRAFLKAKGWL